MSQLVDAARQVVERFLAAPVDTQLLWGGGGLLFLYMARLVLEACLVAAAPRRGRRVLGSAGSPPRIAKRAEKRYGQELRHAGFSHVGSVRFRRALGPSLDFDHWAAPELGMFATVMPDGNGLSVCSYFLEGPAVVLTGNYRGRGGKRRRLPGYWTQYLEGADVAALVAAQQQVVKEFLERAEYPCPWKPWGDFSLDGRIAAEREFDAGYGRSALVQGAVMGLLMLLAMGAFLFWKS